MPEWTKHLPLPLQQTMAEISAYLPSILLAVLIVGAGWLVAILSRKAAIRLLQWIGFDRLAARSGMEAFLEDGGIETRISKILSELLFWIIFLIFLANAIKILRFENVAMFVEQVALYLPHVIVAIVILVFGAILAQFMNRSVFAMLKEKSVPDALTISTGSQYIVMVLVIFLALDQLRIGRAFLLSLFLIIVGSICLALAIAFGLGGQTWAKGVIERITTRKKVDRPGLD